MKPKSAVIADFDGIASALAARPRADVYSSAERFLLNCVPAIAKRALDVGCGDGRITRALARRGIHTVGLDISPGMIALAQSRTTDAQRPLLEYRLGDIMTAPLESYDLVISVSTAHHLALATFVRRLASALTPGGTLLIQDVTTRTGIRHLPVNATAWLARRLRLVPATDASPTVAELYEAHGVGETYLQASEAANVYRAILPDACVHLHLEWRYTVVWRRPSTN
jgi:2-polyprenyl-3-methyl-5-hydroxy-6-metoxy-1,4-benzoquinol methylase